MTNMSFREKLKTPAGYFLLSIVVCGTAYFIHRLYLRDKWKRERYETNQKYANLIYDDMKRQEVEKQQQTFS